MKTIKLTVSDPVAEKIEKMSPLEKKAVSDALSRLLSQKRSLEEIIEEAGEQARKNGLTPELLEKLLKEE